MIALNRNFKGNRLACAKATLLGCIGNPSKKCEKFHTRSGSYNTRNVLILQASWQFRPENWSTHLCEAVVGEPRMLVDAAFRYLYLQWQQTKSRTSQHLMHGRWKLLFIPMALSSHIRGILAPLLHLEELTNKTKNAKSHDYNYERLFRIQHCSR